MKFSSLYIHFPFCETKCHYCDFYSLARERVSESDVLGFEEALLREWKIWKPELSSKLSTLFMGGGTPSMTDPDAMEKALPSLSAHIGSDTEWTLEANPSSVDVDRMKAYRSLGVNRVSMGVQSLRDDHLKWLGRVHERKHAFRSLEAIFNSGITNVSVDLLCGVPGQSVGDIRDALDELTRFPITHLSCYILTLSPSHRMFSMLPNEDVQLEHYLCVHEFMSGKGFDHYEISNFARPGFHARHNLAYWKRHAYLGLGPSAHSFDPAASKRWKNFSSLHKYGESLKRSEKPIEWEEVLTSEQRRIEDWMLALRLDEGFPKTWIHDDRLLGKIEKMRLQGWVEEHPRFSDNYRLTARGFVLSEQIVKELL